MDEAFECPAEPGLRKLNVLEKQILVVIVSRYILCLDMIYISQLGR